MNISIIIPVFNGAKYLDNLYQNLEKLKCNDYEFVFIDDNSQDDSYKKLLALKMKDNRISVFQNDRNRGPGFSRNYGIKKAKYEYVIFLDVDDFLITKTINKLGNTGININEWDIVIFGFIANNIVKKKSNIFLHKMNGHAKKLQVENFIVDWQLHPMSGSSSNKIFKKNFLLSNNIKFPDNWKFFEDYMFILSVFAYYPKVCFIDKPLFIYNINDNNPDSLHNYSSNDIVLREQQTILLFNKYLSILVSYCKPDKFILANTLLLDLVRKFYKNMLFINSAWRIQNLIESNQCFTFALNNCSRKLISGSKQKLFFSLLKNKHYFMLAFLDKCVYIVKWVFHKC